MILDRLTHWREKLTGDFFAATEARRFADEMRAQHTQEWHAWADTVAEHFVTIELTRHERRARRRALSPQTIFTAAAGRGDMDALGLFRVTFTVDEANTRRPFGQMSAGDCRYAADGYRQSSRYSLMMATFLERVATRIKRGTVEEVLSEEQCRKMLISLGGNGDEMLAA